VSPFVTENFHCSWLQICIIHAIADKFQFPLIFQQVVNSNYSSLAALGDTNIKELTKIGTCSGNDSHEGELLAACSGGFSSA